MFKQILNAVTAPFGGIGGLAETAFDAIKAYFPPNMSDEQKAALRIELEKLDQKRTLAAAEAAHEAVQEFNRRIAEMEGTAADLKSIPIIGNILILMRGAQRPCWGFAVLWFDYQIFAQSWKITDQQGSLMIAINVLVLGFLFGERAVKNIAPLLSHFIGKPKIQAPTDRGEL